MDRYICIHGHFYQPPRENPWLEAIELQDSAYPYHDWNERITAECYARNAAARILGNEGRVRNIVNNYSKISFNFGPTLLSWMEAKAPDISKAILDADRRSRRRFSGHGSAMAQPYNHLVLPLAHRRDKYTQVRWGLRDFEHRFGRTAEGMWLPETAVDLETLEVLAELGVKFTILSPHQASRVRRINGRNWRDVSGARIDPTQAYQIRLPSDRRMALFFYDGPISRAVAFEGLLQKGEHLAGRLLSGFSDSRNWPQLVHIATDGETYGHHHHHGEMALAYAIQHLEKHKLAKLTNYGEYLQRHPPTQQVEIIERTSWSCSHGVDRWWRNCGCNSGRRGWNQEWRTPLRNALDFLRDSLAPCFEERAGELFKDPWAARDDYIEVILDRSQDSREAFLARHAVRDLSAEEEVLAWKLLEMQRHAQLMFTSCGWFFDEISGIETVQVIQYAGRTIQLAEEALGVEIERRFLDGLRTAKSNLPEHQDGERIYQRFVKPAIVTREKIGAHYAISSLFEDYGDQTRFYCFTCDREKYRLRRAGQMRLAVGRGRFTSEITRATAVLDFAVLHFGDHNLSGGVRPEAGPGAFRAMSRDLSEAFARRDFTRVVRAMDQHFGDSRYSLNLLFRDEQRKILSQILDSTLNEAAAIYGQVYERHASLLRFLVDLGVPLPKVLQTTAEFVITSSLRWVFEEENPDLQRARALLDSASREEVALDSAGLVFAMEQGIERLMQRLLADPLDLDLLERAETLVGMARSMPFEVNFWRAQNLYFDMLRRVLPEVRERDPQWTERFQALGRKLSVAESRLSERRQPALEGAA